MAKVITLSMEFSVNVPDITESVVVVIMYRLSFVNSNDLYWTVVVDEVVLVDEVLDTSHFFNIESSKLLDEELFLLLEEDGAGLSLFLVQEATIKQKIIK